MNVIIPAEASLDVYKAAYIIFKKRQLKMCNLEITYPTRAFTVADRDIAISVHVNFLEDQKVTQFNGFHDVMQSFGNPVDMRFLEHIPDAILFCFKNEDRTLLAAQLFAAFDAFESNLRESVGVPELIASRELRNAGGYNILIGKGDKYLSPEERITLFKSRQVQFVVFETGDSYGVQKCISYPLPDLTLFARDYLSSDRACWFVHRRGHLVVSKTKCTPSVSVDDLVTHLCEFLDQNSRINARS